MSNITLLTHPVPRSKTALMQHLQHLVGISGYTRWCGGKISSERLPDFLLRMERRYPALTRSPRARCYDRKRDRAGMHMVLWPIIPRASIALSDATSMERIHAAADPSPPDAWLWWMVSSDGSGGLCDPTSEDARVAHDAMDSEHHIVFEDYVLLMRHKEIPVQVPAPNGRSRTIWRGTSTWTWALRSQVLREVRGEIAARCKADQSIGSLLALQRNRPLFGGVRAQVIELHRYAQDEALRVCPRIAQDLIPLRELKRMHLPIMRRLAVFTNPRRCVRDLINIATS